MAKMFKKVNGVWKPLTLSKNMDGTFKKIKKAFRKIDGVWRPIHSGVVEFTFASSITATTPTGILLSNYIDPNSADEFVITVNSGVTLSGMTGTTGAAGYNNTKYALVSNCHGTNYGSGGNGGNGEVGGYPLNFTGFETKKVTIVNNGVLKGGSGGKGGNGGAPNLYYLGCGDSAYGGCGGAGGAGRTVIASSLPASFSILGNPFTAGSAGTAGTANNVSGSGDCPASCFLRGSLVLMADGSQKPIEDVKIGEEVRGAFGGVNTVMFYERPPLAGRYMYKINGLWNTEEHGFLRGDRKGFLFINKDYVEKNSYNTYHTLMDKDGIEFSYLRKGLGKIPRSDVKLGDYVYGINGPTQVTSLEKAKFEEQTLYHLYVDGDHTYCISDIFVSSFTTEEQLHFIEKLGEEE